MTENVNESKPSRMTFCTERYELENEMWEDLKTFLQIITKNGYVAVVRADDVGLGVYLVDYNYDDEAMGCEMPFWLSDEEVERLEAEAGKGEEDE